MKGSVMGENVERGGGGGRMEMNGKWVLKYCIEGGTLLFIRQLINLLYSHIIRQYYEVKWDFKRDVVISKCFYLQSILSYLDLFGLLTSLIMLSSFLKIFFGIFEMCGYVTDYYICIIFEFM